MFLFDKEIDKITENDLVRLEQFSNNFESHRLDYKATYEMQNVKHKHEFLRDVVSFANRFEDSMIIYGMTDSRVLIGMEIKHDFNEDIIQNHLINLLETSIVPKIKSHIKIQPISVKTDRFAIIVKILSSSNIIYAIQQKLDKSIYGKKVDAYEFWYRSSGNKKQMNLEEIIKQIRYRFKPNLEIKHRFTYDDIRDISNLLKKTETNYVKIAFDLKNIGESPANRVVIRLSCITLNTFNFLNKWEYSDRILDKKRKLQPVMTNIIEEIKKIKKMKSPSFITQAKKRKIIWTFQFFIDLIGPEDKQVLPPIYLKIPDNLKSGEINFDVKIFSSEDVQYEEKRLALCWKKPKEKVSR